MQVIFGVQLTRNYPVENIARQDVAQETGVLKG